MDDIFSYENLKSADRNVVDILDDATKSVINEERLEEYLSETYSGRYFQEMVREQLIPFIKFLRYRMDLFVCDYIIDTIEEYPEEELAEIRKRSKIRQLYRKESL